MTDSGNLPTWQLVLDASAALGGGDPAQEFTLRELVAAVQALDPARGRESIQPVIQGMTANATGGPPSPCGKPLRRVAHGVYFLRTETGGESEWEGFVAPPARPPAVRAEGSRLLTEDEVKTAVSDHLSEQGYRVQVAWGRTRGVDIDARRPGDRLLLEAKGAVTLQPQQVNYFLGAIGELVQRMEDEQARYGLALPDNLQYRGLVRRLPAVARRHVVQVVLFVSLCGNGYSVEWEERERGPKH